MPDASITRTYQIAAIPADGVGVEVVAAGRAVLDAIAAGSNGAFAFGWTEFPWGCGYYEKTGRMMDEDALEVLRHFDAIYFGAVGWPTVPDHISLWGLRLTIAQNFDQWANVRPVHFHRWAGATCPGAGRATRSPCRPRCSPRRDASASSGSPSTWPGAVR